MKVRIKTWKEMEKEFGLGSGGSVLCGDWFTEDMEDLIPKDRIIEIDCDDNWIDCVATDCLYYKISDDMIKEKIEEN